MRRCAPKHILQNSLANSILVLLLYVSTLSTVHISLSVWFGSAVWECFSTVHISLSVWFGSAVCEYLSTVHISLSV